MRKNLALCYSLRELQTRLKSHWKRGGILVRMIYSKGLQVIVRMVHEKAPDLYQKSISSGTRSDPQSLNYWELGLPTTTSYLNLRSCGEIFVEENHANNET